MRRFVILIGLLLFVCISCSANTANDGSALPHSEDSLSSTETCDAGTAAAVIAANGFVRSADGNYNPSGCFRGYKVDVNNYTPGVTGMLGGFGGPAPTSQTACEAARFQAYIWRRNNDGTRTLLGNRVKRGTWIASAFGGFRCATPSVDLTMAFGTQLIVGANYRVTMQAKIEGPAEGTADDVYQKVFLSIPPDLRDMSASRLILNGANLRTYLINQPTSAVDNVTQSFWDIQGKPHTSGMSCRSLEILLSVYRVQAVALKRMVPSGSAALIDRRVDSGQQIYNLLCDNPFPSGSDISSLKSALIDDFGWAADVQATMQSFLNVSSADAADLISNSLIITIQRMAGRCGAVPSEISNYITFGNAPAGKVGANLLQRNCSGTPTQIAAAIGVGVDTGGDPKTKFKACMDAQNAALMADRCSGPRTQAVPDVNGNTSPAPAGSPAETPPDCGTLVWSAEDRVCVPADASAEVRRELIQENQNIEESSRRVEAFREIGTIHLYAAGSFALGSGYAASSVVGSPLAPPLMVAAIGEGVLAVVNVAIGALHKLSAENSLDRVCLLTAKADPRCTGNPLNRCAEYDLQGDRAWFQTAPTPLFPDGREMGRQDTLQDCSCKLFEKDYSALPSAFQFGGPVSWCSQTADEKLQAECLRNPEDTRGAPKQACLKLMQPKEVDRNALMARWCHDKMPDCIGAYVDDTGNCGCPNGIGNIPASGPPSCANAGDAANCGPDGYFDEKTCRCTFFDSGLGCAKGGMAGYLTKTPNDLFTAMFPAESALANRNFLMVASGNTPIVTPEVQKAGLKDLTQLSLAVRLPTPTVASRFQGWAAQISCTNIAAGVQNRSLTTLQFQNLNPGLNNLTFALKEADRTACFNGDASPARIEIRTNNQVGQPRIGLEDFTVTNRMINRVDDFLPDPCNVPAPPTVPTPRPDPTPFATLFTLPQGWTFSDGVLVLQPALR